MQFLAGTQRKTA